MGVPWGAILAPRRSRNMYTCIWISGEQKWLPKGPPLNTEVWLPPEIHFGELFWIYQRAQMALSEEPKWIQLVRKSLKCPNGSLGSQKSSFSFISVISGCSYISFISMKHLPDSADHTNVMCIQGLVGCRDGQTGGQTWHVIKSCHD